MPDTRYLYCSLIMPDTRYLHVLLVNLDMDMSGVCNGPLEHLLVWLLILMTAVLMERREN